MSEYHIIGDIHGHADKLSRLLTYLGYKHNGKAYEHPSAKVVFLGDFIDRGRQHRHVLDIVRPMVDNGHAYAVMGNHEFNAICFHSLHPETMEPLRPHDDKNYEQHKEFLDEYALYDDETKSVISWFKTLPIYLEMKNGEQTIFRAIHASWSDEIVARVPVRLTDEDYVRASEKGSQLYKDIEVLLKGPEMKLPVGVSFRDKSNFERHEIRLKWWATSKGSSYADVAMVPDGEEEKLPKYSIPDSMPEYRYPNHAPPVFFGHYWMTGSPRVIAENLACLDYSAGKGGDLVAYKLQLDYRNKASLKDSGYVWVKQEAP